MEKIDWTKPIEWVNSHGDVFNAYFTHRIESGSCKIKTPYGYIYCDEYGVIVGGIPGCVRNVVKESPPETVTLRDQFAMAALATFAAAPCCNYKEYAETAYRLADAMLAARKDTGND